MYFWRMKISYLCDVLRRVSSTYLLNWLFSLHFWPFVLCLFHFWWKYFLNNVLLCKIVFPIADFKIIFIFYRHWICFSKNIETDTKVSFLNIVNSWRCKVSNVTSIVQLARFPLESLPKGHFMWLGQEYCKKVDTLNSCWLVVWRTNEILIS